MKRSEARTDGYRRELVSLDCLPESVASEIREDYHADDSLFFEYHGTWHYLGDFMRLRYPGWHLPEDYWHASDGYMLIRHEQDDMGDDCVIVGVAK